MKLKFGKSIKCIIASILTICFLITVLSYRSLPNKIVTHWDVTGQPNESMSKIPGLIITPLMLLGLDILFFILPNIDPLKRNVLKFKSFYEGFIILFSIFLLLIQMHLILWNLGMKINPFSLILIFLPLFFFYIGILCEKSKRNWFIGIRNPWTLSSDFVWEKTNRLAGRIFKISAIILLFCAFFPSMFFYLIIVDAFVIIVVTFIYSYKLYQKRKK